MATDKQKLKAAVLAEVRKRESSKGFSKKVTSRKLPFKSKQITAVIKISGDTPSILGQQNRFFSQLNEDVDEMNLFL